MHNFASLGQIGGIALPIGVFNRLNGKITAEEAIWTCAICGEIAPRLVNVQTKGVGYLPGKCQCQKQEESTKDLLQIRKEREEGKEKRLSRCFNWLGDTRPGQWQTMILETFEHEESMQINAYSIALDFIEKPCNLILWSHGYGTGKTHLATALCNFMQQERGRKCLFAACQDLFRAIEARWDNPKDYQETYSDLVKQSCTSDLLVLDDIGRVGKYRKELDEIVDRRHNGGKQTIITLNAPTAKTEQAVTNEIERFIGGAATDRLYDESVGGLVVCEMSGPSWRRRKR